MDQPAHFRPTDRPRRSNHRRFDFWDCLHLAIIVEMRSLGMQLSGRDAILSESFTAVSKAHVAREGDINFVPRRIALYALDDAAEWRMDWETSPDRLPRSYVVLNLRGVVNDVKQRYHAVIESTQKSYQRLSVASVF